MKKIVTIMLCCLLVSCGINNSNSEFDKITIEEELHSNLFNTTEYILNPLTIKTESGYDNVLDSTQYVVQSNAIVNKDSLRLMRFAELKQIHSDTLKLNIYEINPLYSQNLTIKIVDNKFTSSFEFDMSGPPIEPKIKRLKQELTLKAFPRQKGEVVFGKFYFKGICKSDCNEEIEIEGDFKAELE